VTVPVQSNIVATTPSRKSDVIYYGIAGLVVFGILVRIINNQPLSDAAALTVRFNSVAGERQPTVQYSVLPNSKAARNRMRRPDLLRDFHTVQDLSLPLVLHVPVEQNAMPAILGGKTQFRTLLLRIVEPGKSPPVFKVVDLPEIPTKEQLIVDLP
jgi:hypothetical protein